MSINQPEGGYGSVVGQRDHHETLELEKINEFLKGNSWACKGPVRLIYKENIFNAGRLITRYQNIPDRRLRVRINTTINGSPLAEVDYSANHLRLNLAVFSGEDAGDTPYEDICEIASINDRQKCKNFITRAMGASSQESALNACHLQGISSAEFHALREATLKRYPKVRIFEGFGVNAQSIEGQILKDAMLTATDAGKVLLPVHDAAAVVQSDVDWAQDLLLELWEKHANTKGGKAKARLKVDMVFELEHQGVQ